MPLFRIIGEKVSRWTMSQRLLASHALAVLGGAGGWWLWVSFHERGGGLVGLVILGLALSIWLLSSRWAVGWIGLPLFSLRDEVSQMGKGNPGRRIQASSSDVIGELAVAVNSAVQRLEASLATLQQTNGELTLLATKQAVELDEQNRTIESVVDAISHDLKATAVSMQSLAGGLLDKRKETVASEEDLNLRRLLAVTEYQERILRDLLTLIRIGKEMPMVREVDIEVLLKKVIEDCQAEAGASSVRFQLPPYFPAVSADPSHLEAVFNHLIENAIKFMGEQHNPEVGISVEEQGEWVQFSIRDNGTGIDPAYHGKIFEPFHRLGGVEFNGTGVGLTIVKKIVQRSGGRVWVESEDGQGTTVLFTLPKDVPAAIRRKYEVRV